MPASSAVPGPLAASAGRVAGRYQSLRVGPVEGLGWRTCRQVIEDQDARRDWQDGLAAYLRAQHGAAPRRTVAAYLLDAYAGVVASTGAAMLSVERRVPRLGPADLAFRVDADSWPVEVALLDPRFRCLPDDPDAGHPDAEPVPDLAALGAVLRAQVRAHADAFIAAFAPGVRLPRRGLLGAFSDSLDVGSWEIAQHTGDGDRAVADGLVVLPPADTEFGRSSSLYWLTDAAGREHLTVQRVGCCHYYVVPDGEACVTCPRTGPAERADRAAAWPAPVACRRPSTGAEQPVQVVAQHR